MRVARPVILTAEKRQALEQRARARSLPAGLVERSRIVLLAAGGKLEHPHPGRRRGNQPDQRSAYLAGAWAETLFSYQLPAISFQLSASS